MSYCRLKYCIVVIQKHVLMCLFNIHFWCCTLNLIVRPTKTSLHKLYLPAQPGIQSLHLLMPMSFPVMVLRWASLIMQQVLDLLLAKLLCFFFFFPVKTSQVLNSCCLVPAYCTGLLLARRVLKMLEMDAEYEGHVEVHGMSFFVFVVKNCNSTLGY